MSIARGSVVSYTSKAGRTALYNVTWVGPSKWDPNETRVGLTAAYKGAKTFFVGVEFVRELNADGSGLASVAA